MSALRVTLKPSMPLCLFILAQHCLAFVLLAFLPFSWWLTGLLALGIGLCLLYQLRTHVFRCSRQSIIALGQTRATTWWIQTQEGDIHTVIIGPQTRLYARVLSITVQYSHSGKSRHVLILPSMLDQSQFKPLIIALHQLQ